MLSLVVAMTIVLGERLSHQLSVCLKKEDAVEIVNTEATKGFEAAMEVWMAKAECEAVPVVGPTVGKIVYAAEVKREGKALTLRVFEIVHEEKVVGYFISSANLGHASGVPGTEKVS